MLCVVWSPECTLFLSLREINDDWRYSVQKAVLYLWYLVSHWQLVHLYPFSIKYYLSTSVLSIQDFQVADCILTQCLFVRFSPKCTVLYLIESISVFHTQAFCVHSCTVTPAVDRQLCLGWANMVPTTFLSSSSTQEVEVLRVPTSVCCCVSSVFLWDLSPLWLQISASYFPPTAHIFYVSHKMVQETLISYEHFQLGNYGPFKLPVLYLKKTCLTQTL